MRAHQLLGPFFSFRYPFFGLRVSSSGFVCAESVLVLMAPGIAMDPGDDYYSKVFDSFPQMMCAENDSLRKDHQLSNRLLPEEQGVFCFAQFLQLLNIYSTGNPPLRKCNVLFCSIVTCNSPQFFFDTPRKDTTCGNVTILYEHSNYNFDRYKYK